MMKKIFTFFFALLLSVSMKAQTTLTEAVDFTVTDIHGRQVNLFEILDRGQYVLIDFFYRNCPPCGQAMPKVVSSYYSMGCNKHDIFYMEISYVDDNEVLETWVDYYGVEYPTIGREGGGASVTSAYGVSAFPTVIVIAPDRSIVIDDLYPIFNPNNIIEPLEALGLEQHECPDVMIEINEVTAVQVTATFTPRENCASYHYIIGMEENMQNWSVTMGMSIVELIKTYGFSATDVTTYTWEGLTPLSEYTIYVVPVDADGNDLPMVTEVVETVNHGGAGVSIITLEPEVLSDTSVLIRAYPNEETAEYHYGIISLEVFNEIGLDSTLSIIRNDEMPLIGYDEWPWYNLTPNTEYYAVGNGVNTNGEWGEVALVPFTTTNTSVADNQQSRVRIYPNPATSYVMIEASNVEAIEIYNTIGQLVEMVSCRGPVMMLSTDKLQAGLYFVKAKGNVVGKFVVR